MPVQDQALLERIAKYAFPDDGPIGALRRSVRFDFSRIHQVEQALVDYRRFLYLLATHDDSLLPSPIIAAIWFGHAKDRRTDYERFQSDVIGRRLPHLPTGKFDPASPAYLATRQWYAETFGSVPNLKIWPDKAILLRSQRYRWAAYVAFVVSVCFTFNAPHIATPLGALHLFALVSSPALYWSAGILGPWTIGWPPPDHASAREDTILDLPEGENYRNAIG